VTRWSIKYSDSSTVKLYPRPYLPNSSEENEGDRPQIPWFWPQFFADDILSSSRNNWLKQGRLCIAWRWGTLNPIWYHTLVHYYRPAMPASPIASNYTRNEQWAPLAVYGKRAPLRRKLRGQQKLTRRAPKTTRKATRWTRTSWLPVKADRPKHGGLTPRGGVLRKVGPNDRKKRNGVHDKTWLALSRGKKCVSSERDEVLSRTGLAATVVGRRRVVVRGSRPKR